MDNLIDEINKERDINLYEISLLATIYDHLYGYENDHEFNPDFQSFVEYQIAIITN